LPKSPSPWLVRPAMPNRSRSTRHSATTVYVLSKGVLTMKFLTSFLSAPDQKRPARWRVVSLMCLMAVAQTAAQCAYSQEMPRKQLDLRTLASTGRMHPAPLSHLYMSFLLHQNHLDRVASKFDSSGKNGNEVRGHFQAKLGFDEGKMTTIRST